GGQPRRGGPAGSGRPPGAHRRAVLAAEARVQLAGRAGDALGEDAGRLGYEHAHRATLFAAETAFCAPSSMSPAVMMSRPESARICLPFSTFVPSMRTTSGTDRPTS